MQRFLCSGGLAVLICFMFSAQTLAENTGLFAYLSGPDIRASHFPAHADRESSFATDNPASPTALAALNRLTDARTQNWYPLHWAAVQNDAEEINRLVARGQAVDRRDINGRTPLMAAAAFGNREAAEALLQLGADPFATDDLSGDAAIHFAARSGKTPIIELLLDNGLPIGSQAVRSGATALHYAAMYGQRDTVAFLLSHGADPNAADRGGVTPLFYASKRGRLSLVALLQEAGARPGRLMEAVNANDVGRVYRLIADGADVNERGFAGSPLHLATSKGFLGIAGILVDNGAELDAGIDLDNTTPLHLAALNDVPALAGFLLSRGASVDAIDSQGRSPLIVAAIYGSTRTARVLLANGAQATLADSIYAMAPIHWAALHGSGDIIDMLAASGADINLRDPVLKKTPLHFAVQKSRLRVIAQLVALGAKIDAVDASGRLAGDFVGLNPDATRELLNELKAAR